MSRVVHGIAAVMPQLPPVNDDFFTSAGGDVQARNLTKAVEFSGGVSPACVERQTATSGERIY